MANTEDILAEINGLLKTPDTTATASPIASDSSSEWISSQPDLQPPSIDTYTSPSIGQYSTTSHPTITLASNPEVSNDPYWYANPSLLSTALTPSPEAAKETAGGMWNLLKRGVGATEYGLSYLSPFEAFGSGYRKSVDAAEEKAAKDAQVADEKLRVQMGMTPDQYADFKAQKANTETRHVGGQLVGGLTGAGVGSALAGGATATAMTGASLAFPPLAPIIMPWVPAATTAASGVGALIGSYFGAGAGETAVQKMEEAAGWTPKISDEERAKKFSEAGTSGAVGEITARGLGAGYRGTVKAGQAGRAWLGPKTSEEALAVMQPKLEPVMPEAKVRSAIGRGTATQQTSEMRTTGELLGTPKALHVEQAIGLDPFKQEAYNIRVGSNIEESQKFLTDNVLTKNLLDESKVAKANPILDVEGNVIPETAPSHLKTGQISHGTIGKEMENAFDDAVKKSDKAVSKAYGEIEHTDTTANSMKYAMHDALKRKYPLIEGKTGKTGTTTMEYSGAPSELTKLVDQIGSKKIYNTNDLQKWQSQLRSMAKRFARAGNDTAASAAGDIRTALTSQIKKTTAADTWTGAKAAAKEQADLIENHELGKVLKKEDLNGETVFNKVTSSESNANNFVNIVGEDHPVIRSGKAYAIKTIDSIDTAAGKAQWIKDNQKWLKPFYRNDPKGLQALNELANVGKITSKRAKILNALGGSPTARRTAAERYGLGRILGRGEDVTSRQGKAIANAKRNIERSLSIGGSTLGGALAFSLGGGPIGAGIGSLLGGLALTKGKNVLALRRALGTDLLHEAAYDIAMNPKTAGYTAPRLAKEYAARQAAQVRRAGIVGETAGRLAQAGAYGEKLSPPKEAEKVKRVVASRPTSAHAVVNDALNLVDNLLSQISPNTATKTPTPNAVGEKTKSTTKGPVKARLPEAYDVAEVDKHLASKPPIIRAIALAESGDKKDAAISPKGARGRMQLMPETAQEMGGDINNPISNIDSGEAYYNRQLNKYKDERIALMAYNWGPGRVETVKKRLARNGMDLTWDNIKKHIKIPEETRTYIDRVLNNKKKFERA